MLEQRSKHDRDVISGVNTAGLMYDLVMKLHFQNSDAFRLQSGTCSQACAGVTVGLRSDCSRFALGLHSDCTRVALGLQSDCSLVCVWCVHVFQSGTCSQACAGVTVGLRSDCSQVCVWCVHVFHSQASLVNGVVVVLVCFSFFSRHQL